MRILILRFLGVKYELLNLNTEEPAFTLFLNDHLLPLSINIWLVDVWSKSSKEGPEVETA